MELLKSLCQLLIALGILNVWLLRFRKPTAYRGGSATSMKEEFAAYGLPSWTLGTVGALKISSAIALLLAFVLPIPVSVPATIVAILMAGAVMVHIKVNDPPKKMLPAAIMLMLSLVVIFA